MRRKKISKQVRLLFDFYAINELYLRCGGFREIGYHKYDVFVSEKIFDKVKFKYEEVVDLLFNDIVSCLAGTVRGELINNFYNCAYLPKKTKNPLEETFLTHKILSQREGYTLKIFYRNGIIEHADKASHLFRSYLWDTSYGGELWAKAADALNDLKNVKTFADKVYWIDRVLDLQHNNGHILNKTRFSSLSIYRHYFGNTTCLDFRANCKSIFDFIDFCSNSIRNLIIPRKRILI